MVIFYIAQIIKVIYCYQVKKTHCGLMLTSLQNVAGFDEISSGQTPQVGAEIGAGFRNIGAETGKSGGEVKKFSQSHRSDFLSFSLLPTSLYRYIICIIRGGNWAASDSALIRGRILSAPKILSSSLPCFADWLMQNSDSHSGMEMFERFCKKWDGGTFSCPIFSNLSF